MGTHRGQAPAPEIEGGRRAYQDQTALLMANELEEIIERLEEIADWAIDGGHLAVTHKIEEALGRLGDAAEAGRQYHTGELRPRDV